MPTLDKYLLGNNTLSGVIPLSYFARILALAPAAWVKADRITGLNDDAYVATWADISGNARNATQAGADSVKPKYKTNILNGKPVVRFDGGDWLTFGTVLGKPANFTVFIVSMTTNAASEYATHCSSADSVPNAKYAWGMVQQNAATAKQRYMHSDGTNASYGATDDVTFVNNVFAIRACRYTTGQNYQAIWINGASKAITAVSTAATTNTGTAYGYSLGRNGEYNGTYLTGDIAEFIVFTKALTDAEITTVNYYLSYQWAI